MKLKYYLRGVGAGILFATIILSVSYHVSSKSQLSDTEIIKKAEGLGMVKQSDVNIGDIIAPSATSVVEPTVTPSIQPTAVPTTEPTVKPTDTPSIEPTKTPTLIPTKEPVKSTEETEATPKATNESGDKYVSFQIITGMTSEDVSNLLKEKGIIEDAKAFNQYLIQNNYTTEINIGVFQIEKYASYQDIADVIVTK
ncbi:MAG: PT domain-containing protein [Anaerocolumna sp.]